MAGGMWHRLGPAIGAFRRTLAGLCAAPDCIGGERLEHLLAAAPVVLYVLRWSPDFPPTFVSANIQRFTGITADALLGRPALWRAAIHPDDRDRYGQALAELAEHGRLALDYRLRHAEGGWRWVRDEARVQLDAAGQPAEVVGSWLDITDRRASEQALAAGEAQLRAAQTLLTDALESSGDAFSLFDADDRLVVFNSRYKEFYATINDIIRPGVAFEELIRASALRGQYADADPAHVDEWVAERMAHHRVATGVFEQRLADGRCLEIVERPTSDGGRVAIRRDVTARKRVEEALRRELTFEQVLIDALPIPVFFKGRDGRYLGCNAKFAEAMGLPIAAIVGRTVHDLMPPDKAAEYATRDQDLFANPGIQVYETTMRWGDGGIRRLNVVKGTYANADGVAAGFVGSLIDLTQQKRAEEQLVQAAKLATLGQIASEVAHELNQPLSIIRMSAERCLEAGGPIEPERLERKLSTIVGQVRRMAEMVDHLRSFSRLESGTPRPFAPAAVVASTARLLALHFQLDGIALETHIDTDCPDVLGQPNLLEQVVLNLLGNARDAVREHRDQGQGRVRLALACDGDEIILTVQDNGGGVSDALWPMLFEPFFTTKADGTGTGLGLSITANIVAGMGGHIGGRNADGGACFTITLPVAHAAVAAAEPAEPPPAPQSPTPAPRGRILVVDDEELAVECIVEFLASRGFACAGATSPERALDLARAQRPDLVISDLRLPGMPGTALLARLRAELGDLPCILVTGGPLPADADADAGAGAGSAVLMGKPLALNEVLAQAERLLNGQTAPCLQ